MSTQCSLSLLVTRADSESYEPEYLVFCMYERLVNSTEFDLQLYGKCSSLVSSSDLSRGCHVPQSLLVPQLTPSRRSIFTSVGCRYHSVQPFEPISICRTQSGLYIEIESFLGAGVLLGVSDRNRGAGGGPGRPRGNRTLYQESI